MTREAGLRLRDVLDSIERIDAYRNDPRAGRDLVRDAVLLRLMLIGEAVNALPASVLARAPEVPWSSIVGFRNLAIHQYWTVEDHRLDAICDASLPALKAAVQHVIAHGPDDLGVVG